jgi:tetratricopeptide (TPR) repeat protein
MTTRFLALGAILCATAFSASAKPYCGEITSHQYDYRTIPEHMLKLVHARHFTEEVEHGIKGESAPLGSDLEYTLMHIPNHPRALNTLLRLVPRYPNGTVVGAKFPIECFFERAVRFHPDDSNTWLMYARFAFAKGREGQALEMLQKAHELAPEDPAINYNIGLVYAKQKKFEQALPFAQKAYSLQFPLPALKQTLVKAGVWAEPPPPPAEEAAEDKGEEKGKAKADDKTEDKAKAAAPAETETPVKQ